MSLPRRLQLLEWARRCGALIFEDDYDSEYRYSGGPVPALQSLDRNGCVLFAGSFSKVLFPSLRLGYLVIPEDLVTYFAAAKSITTRHAQLLDKNEAAGTADACGVRGNGPFAFSAIALVTEKGDLCDHTHPADARVSRTPQLCRINHPKLSAHSRGFSAVRSEAARSSGTGRHPALPGLPAGGAQARYRNGIELCCRPPVLLREDAEAPFRERRFAYPHGVKRKRRLPTILSQEEVGRLIDSSKNLFHYAMLLTMYSTGLRRSELCRLKVANIDSQRMMLRVERGKGDVDREVPISQKLVETLREYWRWMRPQTYMFPGTADGWRA